jgi:hypothetical protein
MDNRLRAEATVKPDLTVSTVQRVWTDTVSTSEVIYNYVIGKTKERIN